MNKRELIAQRGTVLYLSGVRKQHCRKWFSCFFRVIQNGLVLKGSVLHLLKFRGFSSSSYTNFLTMCGHLEIVVHFALPPFPCQHTPTSCAFLFSSEDGFCHFLPVGEWDDVPASRISSSLQQDGHVKALFAFRTPRDALEQGWSYGHVGKQMPWVGYLGTPGSFEPSAFVQ